jgi:transcriptional regulator with XRE-family HTH domain
MPKPKTKLSHLGARIRRLRRKAKLSQLDLARRIGQRSLKTGGTYISRLEAGRENPSFAMLTRISKALKIQLSELL